MKKLIVLNRKLKENEEVNLLTDSSPDNWRGENGEKIVKEIVNCSIIHKVNKRPKVDC